MKTSFTRLIGIITLIICSKSVVAEQFKYGDLYYQTINANNNVIVVPPESGKYNMVYCQIPSTFEYQNVTYTVTGIGKNAFYGCSNLMGVELPQTLQTIGEWAFYNSKLNSNRYSIVIPNSVTTIEEYAFGLCSNLEEIQLSSTSNLNSIGRSAFSSSGLRNIKIPASVTSIGKSAFASCDKLSTIIVEEGNEYYDSRENCNAIIQKSTKTLIVGCAGTNQRLPDGITAISDNAFYGSKLQSIILPSSVTSIGEWAFYNCGELNNVTMSNSITTIGEYAFGLCSKLLGLSLPEGLLTIGRSAFSSSGLKSISIPASVMLIGDRAFAGCDKLTTMQVLDGNKFYESPNGCNAIIQGKTLIAGCSGTNIIPEVTTIGENAFYGSGITNVNLPSTVTNIEEWAFYNCGELKAIDLSNVVYIDEYAFGLCSELSTITLPSTVKNIGKRAFSSCDKLLTIKSKIQTPFAITEDVFADETYSGLLEVPLGTKELYKQTDYWSKFAEKGQITEYDPSGIASPNIALQRIYSDNGIIYIESATDGNCNIYSMSGQLMRKLVLKKGTNTVSGLSKGIYIINGNKVMVK